MLFRVNNVCFSRGGSLFHSFDESDVESRKPWLFLFRKNKHWLKSGHPAIWTKRTHTQKEALGWGLFARFVRFMWSDVGRSWRAAPIYFATWWCFFFRYSQCLRTPEALTWLAGKIAQILRGETSSKGLVLVCKAAVSPPGMQSWQMKAVKGRDSGANKMPYQPGGFPGILGGG